MSKSRKWLAGAVAVILVGGLLGFSKLGRTGLSKVGLVAACSAGSDDC